MKTSSEYKAFIKRINVASTMEQLNELDEKIDKIYNAGCMSANELSRLDIKILNKKIEIENEHN